MAWYDNKQMADITDLAGLTFQQVNINEDRDVLLFTSTDGRNFQMYHKQDCCETAYLNDNCGKLDHLI